MAAPAPMERPSDSAAAMPADIAHAVRDFNEAN